jgi:hypothetical protein
MLTINTMNVGASNSDGISGNIWMGWNEATNDSMPLHPDGVSVAVVIADTIMTIKVVPYPMLNSVARTADQNPIRLTDLGMVPVEANES